MVALLSDLDCAQIRAALDSSLDASVLPDTVIFSQQFVGAAQAEIERRDPLLSTRTRAELVHMRRAAVLLTAAFLVPRLVQITQETFGGTQGYRYQREPIDQDATTARLRAEAADAIALVLTDGDPSSNRPTGFAAGGSVRGRHREWW